MFYINYDYGCELQPMSLEDERVRMRYEWRCSPEFLKGCKVPVITTIENHKKYEESMVDNPSNQFYDIVIMEDLVGQCGFYGIDETFKNAELFIYLNPKEIGYNQYDRERQIKKWVSTMFSFLFGDGAVAFILSKEKISQNAIRIGRISHVVKVLDVKLLLPPRTKETAFEDCPVVLITFNKNKFPVPLPRRIA